MWSDWKLGEWAELILKPLRHFTYVTTHSPILPLLYLRHSSFFNPSVASHTSQFILQPIFRFSYVTSPSLNSPGEPPMHLIWSCCSCSTKTIRFRTRVHIQNFIFSFFPAIIKSTSLRISMINIHFFLYYKLFLDLENLLPLWVIIITKWPLIFLLSNYKN